MAESGVLITRPAAEAQRTAERVRALGLHPVIAPLLRVETRPVAVPPVQAVLLTSGNAVAAVRGTSLPVFAVGDTTAARARAAGCPNVTSAGGDATDLVALVCRTCPPGSALLLPTGEGQGGGLAADLRAAGFRVHRRVAYVARPVRAMPQAALDAVAGNRLRAALFLSAETARVFVVLLPPSLHPALAGIDALAIGQPVARVLDALPWRRVHVSLTPTLDELLTFL